MNSGTSEIDIALNRLADMVRLVGLRLTEVADSLRGHGASAEAARAHGAVIEDEFNELELVALQAPPAAAVEIIRMVNDVRRMDDLVGRLAAKSHGLGVDSMPAEIRDRLRRMFDLAITLVDQTRSAIAGHDAEFARQAATGEAVLDDWHDLMLGDIFEDVAERGAFPPMFRDLTAVAKLLERIGDRSIETAESATRLLALLGRR